MNRTEELQKVQQERIDARKKAAEEHRARAKEQAAKEAEAQHARTELERQREQEREARDLQRMTNGLWLDYLATPGACTRRPVRPVTGSDPPRYHTACPGKGR